jgi:hypothetical protein
VTWLTGRPSTKRISMGVRPPQPIAGECLGGGIICACRVWDQAHRMVVCPGMQVGVGQAAPPDCVGDPEHPGWMSLGESNQAISGLFLRAYGGSGLVIQCLARFQGAPSR